MIGVSDLRYSYPDGRTALAGIDLEVGAGERVALLGPNGAGKTTLLLAVCGLLRGAVVGDVELTGACGLVFQDPDDQLFMPTVAQDVAFGPRNQGLGEAAVARRVAAALEAVRMSFASDRTPHTLSLGERRRAAIATVLAMTPDVLVLDEPGANLDPRARRELLAVLAGCRETLLVATHDLPFAAELCERTVVLADGRIAADGPTRDVLADAATLARYDLGLPAGFDLLRIERLGPAGARPA